MTDPCHCQEPQDRERVETMLKLAKTRADLQDLVRALDARNVRLQRIRDDLSTRLHHALNGAPQ